MVSGEDWDEKDIGRLFVENQIVKPNYTIFEKGLEDLKPSFVDGITLLSIALKELTKLLAGMVSVFAKELPNQFIPETLTSQWRYLCNKKLLGSEIIRAFKTYLSKEEKIEKEKLLLAYEQIRKKVYYQVDKHNAKISRCLIQARINARKSKKGNEWFKDGDRKCYKSDDEDGEESTEYSDDEEDEDVYAEEESEGFCTNA